MQVSRWSVRELEQLLSLLTPGSLLVLNVERR